MCLVCASWEQAAQLLKNNRFDHMCYIFYSRFNKNEYASSQYVDSNIFGFVHNLVD